MADLRDAARHDPELVRRFVAEGYWNDDRVTDWLEDWARRTPDKVAITSPAGRLTYAEVWRTSLELANGLLGLGLRKGDVVALQLPNIPEFLFAYYATQLIGGVTCLLHMPYRSGEIEPMLSHGGARAVICNAALDNYDAPSTMLELAGRLPLLEHVIVADGPAPDGALALAGLIESGTDAAITNPPLAADPSILAFTSGTSASPKAIVHSHLTFSCGNRTCAETCGLGADDVVMSGPPFTHVYGLCCANIILYAGGTNALMRMFTPDRFVDTIDAARVTVLFCAPAHVATCLGMKLFENRDLSSVRSAIVAGSACPPELARTFETLLPHGRVRGMWGMTESAMSFVTPYDAPPTIRHGTVGRPPGGFEIRATLADGTVLPAGAEGEMEIRGTFLFAGYYGNDAENRACFRADGWFRTGDLVILDRDDNVTMTGRVKDIINRGGIKINPIDIEALIDEHPDVLQSAIAPMPDPVLGEKACLFVVLRPGATLGLGDVTDYLARNDIAKMRWPERLEIVDEMPMTPTRKIIKGKLVERLRDAD